MDGGSDGLLFATAGPGFANSYYSYVTDGANYQGGGDAAPANLLQNGAGGAYKHICYTRSTSNTHGGHTWYFDGVNDTSVNYAYTDVIGAETLDVDLFLMARNNNGAADLIFTSRVWVDELMIFSRELSASDVSDIYNGGSGLACSSFVDPLYQAANIGQTNNTRNNTNTTIGISCTPDTNLYLWYDTSDPPSTLVLENSSIHHYNTSNSDDTYYWKAGCYDPDTGAVEGNITGQWTLDSVTPLTTLATNNAFDSSNITADQESQSIIINMSTYDSEGLNSFEINISKDGNTYFFNNLSISGTTYIYNTSIYVGNWSAGSYLSSILSSDPHTKKAIEDYKTKTKNRELEYETDEGITIKIVTDSDATPNTWKDGDRYKFSYLYADKGKRTRHYDVYASHPIKIHRDSKYEGHLTIYNPETKDGNWIDFEAGMKVTVKRIDDYHVRVSIINAPSLMIFNSIGGLNIETREFIYTRAYTAPAVTLTAPINGNNFLYNATVAINASFTDGTNLSNATLYIWNSTPSLINSSEVTLITGQSNSTSIIWYPTKIDVYSWNFEGVDVYDTRGFAAANRTFNIVNETVASPNPTINDVYIDPTTGINTSDLSAYVNASLPNPDALVYIDYKWYQNGALFRENPTTSECYHETATDITCGNADNGSYEVYTIGGSLFMYINYSKPITNYSGSIWQLKTEKDGVFNITLPDSCYNYFDDRIELSIISEEATSQYINASCYNGSWNHLYSVSGATGAVGNPIGASVWYDGDYSTSAYIGPLSIYYDGAVDATFYEEAIFWTTQLYDPHVYINVDNITANYTQVGDNWTFSVRARGNGTSSAWQNVSASIDPVNIYQCFNDAAVLSFLVFEENNRTAINASSIVGYLNYTSGYGDYTDYSFSNESIHNLSLCITPTFASGVADAYIQYEAEAGIIERYYIVGASINTSEQSTFNLYNFVTDAGLSDLKVILKDSTLSILNNVVVKMQRYYPSLNSYITVQIDKSDEFGQAIFYIYENEVDYKFSFEQGRQVLKITEPLKFICQTSDCEQTFIVTPSDVDSYAGMSYTTSYNNVTGIYSLTWSDTSNLVSSVQLLAQLQTSKDSITICDQTVESSAGTILCNVSGYNGNIVFRAFRSASPEDPFLFDTISNVVNKLFQQTGNNFDVEKTGTLFGILFLMAAAGFGAMSPVALIIMSIMGIIVMFLLGLTSFITLSWLIGGIVLGLVVAFAMRR